MHEVSEENMQPSAGLYSLETLFNLVLRIKDGLVCPGFLAYLETADVIFWLLHHYYRVSMPLGKKDDEKWHPPSAG